jgi:4-hydroxy-3-polyprenylbenzoate decarboxylase
MKTVAAIAHGYADNLIHRVCDIALKEKRQLVIVPRETPLSALHLYNLYTLSMYGASVVMPIPAFYNFPETVDDVVNFIIGRVFDQLHIQHNLYSDGIMKKYTMKNLPLFIIKLLREYQSVTMTHTQC